MALCSALLRAVSLASPRPPSPARPLGLPGTKIRYKKEDLLNIRGSPLSKAQPPNLPNIPGITLGLSKHELDATQVAAGKWPRLFKAEH